MIADGTLVRVRGACGPKRGRVEHGYEWFGRPKYVVYMQGGYYEVLREGQIEEDDIVVAD